MEKIDVQVDFDPPRSLIHARPTTALEGKFSMQYCLAASLLDGGVNLSSFTDSQVLRTEAQEFIPKVNMRRIAGNEGQPSWIEAYNEVEVHLKDGRVLKERADRIDTGALRGTTMDEIRDKFRDCAIAALSDSSSQELLGLLDRLEEVDSLERITELLGGDVVAGIR